MMWSLTTGQSFPHSHGIAIFLREEKTNSVCSTSDIKMVMIMMAGVHSQPVRRSSRPRATSGFTETFQATIPGIGELGI